MRVARAADLAADHVGNILLLFFAIAAVGGLLAVPILWLAGY